MTENAPVVALLFDDTELGAQLRTALDERGARIVHEGPVSSLSRQLLQQSDVDVLVINLDDSAENALDSLYELIEGDRPRVVFNDAQASRSLEGWDRARWARHLAVKVMSAGDIDPPRPQDARVLDMPAETVVPASVSGTSSAVDAGAGEAVTDAVLEDPSASAWVEPLPEVQPDEAAADESWLTDASTSLHGSNATENEQAIAAESESLAAELEALLASGELPDEEESAGSGLRFTESDELPQLHDGNFGASDEVFADHPGIADDDEPRSSFSAHLELEAQVDPSIMTIPASSDITPSDKVAQSNVSAPSGWALLDDAADLSPATPAAADFGIEKVSAADYLAPEADPGAPGLEPVFNLELVSMETAVAPQPYVREHEMVLDELGNALSRIVLTGAAAAGLDSVGEFLGHLPRGTRLTLLHTQHPGSGQSDAAVVEKLAASCLLPVRLAAQGSHARAGEVLVVPAGQHVLMRRDGKIELQSLGTDDGAPVASIDASFTMAANAFGRDAVAIVFAGRANDAVAGSQAIHDRGGQVWVESSSGEHFADMVSGIFAERLVSFSGTPTELAAHLIEVFP
jgi:two-component system chemotaxis response regulator CheB/chemosensory pili system protein ChpB (putative protein-glutamate methylesterase)